MAIPPEAFFLHGNLNGTLQQRIRQLVAEGIVAGRFRACDKMPSSRGLAAQLGVSRITVTLAYTDLVASDYLTSKGRSGYFVSASAPLQPEFEVGPRALAVQVDYAQRTGQRFSGAEMLRRPADWASFRYPFIYGQADASLFDHQNWRQCAVRALGKRDFEALTSDYYDRDDPLLIEYILRNILPRRGIEATGAEVLLTMGAQNALWLAGQVLTRPGVRAAVENPGYPSLRGILAQTGAAVDWVDVDEGGLPPDAIPAGVNVVFTSASHHCPTNATMPMARRRALIEAASARDFVIVEDDYEFEMSFLKAVSPALKSLDREGRVVHVGSFSKSIFPGLRLGYIVAPEGFIREARALRALTLRHPPGHIQRTAAYFLSLGHYDALVNRMKQAFKRRRLAMGEAMEAAGLQVAGQGGVGGSSFWMVAPEGVDTEALARGLHAQGVLIEPGRVFFDPARAPRNYYRLAYSTIPVGRIAEGVGLIAAGIARADRCKPVRPV
ncbi:transcriptional regulator, GntR family [Pseudorhodobacter antarcticus]|jgi:GntR family transcriptional regulator/MocR family aminotransferase|uniref:Transcriptional regulator, GntR family n=1 Tax=Pseudorhodobacter antarcticus TaxID=1077947 RepID=A0A1H8EMH0_9RHOB|nr:PLP-dependent aminotransferase family protein [Pseudorhodobacter antarcticus]SEN19988.1 transcriptional regulator, GntR family [Pseudorhodobacter antarcticus]